MKKLKKPFLFSLAMLPVAALAIWFTVKYQLDLYDEATVQMMLSQIGSMELLMVLTMVQNCGMIFLACFYGYVLAEKVGLLAPVRFEKRHVLVTLLVSTIGGMIMALDYWTFGVWEPMIREGIAAGMTVFGVAASILYGGIVEELLLRLFMMSMVGWLIWKLFFRKKEECPQSALILANIISSILFAAGHLPATILTFGTLTPMLLARCFLLNGGFGLLFGRLYRRSGIQYSMIAHALVHIISKLILFAFL